MNLFLATMYTNGFRGRSNTYAKLEAPERAAVDVHDNLLESYHYVKSDRFVRTMRETGAKVFLDSGAFSAHTLGVEIDIKAYGTFVKENQDILRKEDGIVMASVLDGIGSAQQTYENQVALERMGAKCLPCFHYGEDPRYLDHYLANYPYITIGGMVRQSGPNLIRWLDEVWDNHLIDGAGNARLKVHAFGITSVKIMKRYPWHSVDSSSWIQYAVYGHIFHPRWGVITVSEKSPARKQEGRHYTTLSPIEKRAVLDELARDGFTMERLSTVYESRAAFNACTFGVLQRDMRNKDVTHFRAPQTRLF